LLPELPLEPELLLPELLLPGLLLEPELPGSWLELLSSCDEELPPGVSLPPVAELLPDSPKCVKMLCRQPG